MSKALFWFRKDLRLEDNPGLTFACQNHEEVLFIYIQDEPLQELKTKAQSWWLHHSLTALDQSLQTQHLKLVLKHGEPLAILTELIKQHNIEAVYWNRCYEPHIINRDQHIKSIFKEQGLKVKSFNASLLLEPWEIKNQQGLPFKVFTPYWKRCVKQIQMRPPETIIHWPKNIESPSENINDWQLLPTTPNWADLFPSYWSPGEKGAQEKLQKFLIQGAHQYKDGRDQPALKATSNLSPYLHFGEIGPWQIFRAISEYGLHHPEHEKHVIHFLSELGWREFSYYLLYHFPKLPTENFKSEFNTFPWHTDMNAFERWTKGQTGYPIVDAGMRELWRTGTMHNRVRMIVASFLIKDLFIDWRKGAAWFEKTLLDADLASNSASWQWVAGSGADAAPYFRIFNPVLQGEKFDPEGIYVRQWVPELKSVANKWIHHPWDASELGITLGLHYPHPMVDHSKARDQALQYYQQLKHQ
jgi:deoxyribodipyrimidine photo-lyase